MGFNYDNLTGGNDTDTCIINKSLESYIEREAVQALAARWNMYQSLASFVPGKINCVYQ